MASVFEVTTDSRLMAQDDADGRQFGLWVVVVSAPTGTHTLYVLASTEQAAIGQAKCVLKLSDYSVGEEVRKLIKVDAIQVKFAIEGWGGRQF